MDSCTEFSMAGRHRSLRSTKNLWDPGSGHPCRSCMVWPSPMVRRAGGVPSSPRRWRPASCVLRASESSAPSPGVRSHGRFRNRGTDSLSESGMKWMCGGTQRQRDRALRAPALAVVHQRLAPVAGTGPALRNRSPTSRSIGERYIGNHINHRCCPKLASSISWGWPDPEPRLALGPARRGGDERAGGLEGLDLAHHCGTGHPL